MLFCAEHYCGLDNFNKHSINTTGRTFIYYFKNLAQTF